jgi:lactoylglutathione lyase
MAKVIHAMFRVIDEDRSRDFYARAFDLEAADRYEFDGFTLVYLRNREADFEVELTINHGRTEPYDLGDGYGHIAVAVNDLDAYNTGASPRRVSIQTRSRNSCATAA